MKTPNVAKALADLERVRLADRWSIDRDDRARIISILSTESKMSASQIGTLFGVTRNAVIGFAGRNGAQLRAPAGLQNSRKPRGPKEPAKPRAVALKSIAPKRIRPSRPLPAPEIVRDLPLSNVIGFDEARREAMLQAYPNAVHMDDLKGSHCRYPLWPHARKPTFADLYYCGEAKPELTKPYCERCSRIVNIPKEERAARLERRRRAA